MQKTNFQITVLIPLNSTWYLRETLESIEAQTLPKSYYTVLFVADRIPLEQVEEIAKGFSFSFEVVSSKNAGIVSALNHGVGLVKTEFIARMDADDLMLPYRLEAQLREFKQRPKLVGLGGGMIPFRDETELLDRVYLPASKLVIRKFIGYKNLFSHPTMMLRTSAVRNVGMYRHTKSEDWDLWSRLIDFGEMTNLKTPLIKYRLHDNQVSNLNPTIEPEISALIQLSRWMRLHNFFDFPSSDETPEEWISKLEIQSNTKRKVQKLIRQKKRRISAQKIIIGMKPNSLFGKIYKIVCATIQSPIEVMLTLAQRLYKLI